MEDDRWKYPRALRFCPPITSLKKNESNHKFNDNQNEKDENLPNGNCSACVCHIYFIV